MKQPGIADSSTGPSFHKDFRRDVVAYRAVVYYQQCLRPEPIIEKRGATWARSSSLRRMETVLLADVM